MPDDSGRPDLALVAEERATEDADREHPGEGEGEVDVAPYRGLHYQDETGLRLVAQALADAPDGTVLAKATVEGEADLVLTDPTNASGMNVTAVKTAAYTAVPDDFIPVDISGGSVPVKLPAKPADKTQIGVKLVAISGTPGSTTATITRGGSTDVFNKAGGSTSLTLSALFQGVILQYSAGPGIWYARTTDTPLGVALGAGKTGSDNTLGGPGGSALSLAAVRSAAAPFEGSGTRKPNLSEGNVFPVKMTGALAIEAPEGTPPSTRYGVLLELKQDATGKRAVTFPGMEPLGLAPVIGEAANELTLVELFTNNAGASWFVIGMVQGGVGPEGFVASKYELPSAMPVFKETGAATTENRAILFQSVARDLAISNLTLTSAQTVGALITVPPNKVFTGPSVGIATAEGTPANRTHLWFALLDLTGKVLAVTGDYISSTNTPMESGKARGVKWTAPIAESTEVKQYIVLVANVVSSGAALTLLAVNGGAALMNLAPKPCVLGPAAVTVPPTVGETLALTETSKRLWIGGH